MASHKLIALTNPTPGMEQEFEKWYVNTHLPDVLDVPGFKTAQLFKMRPPPLNVQRMNAPEQPKAGGAPKQSFSYIAIYDIETDDLDATWKILHDRIDTDRMVISPAFDATVQPMLLSPVCDVVGPRKK